MNRRPTLPAREAKLLRSHRARARCAPFRRRQRRRIPAAAGERTEPASRASRLARRARRRRDRGPARRSTAQPVLFAARGRPVHGRRGRRGARRQDRRPARARARRPAARGACCCIDSGGVRLHEANAGLIAISEIMRAVLDARAAGMPVLALIGGVCGAFGGMGIVARLCSRVIMSEEGRLALSGPRSHRDGGGGRGIRRARPRARLARDRRQASTAHRRLRRAGGRRYRCVPVGGRTRACAASASAPALLQDLRQRQDVLARRAQRLAGLRDGADVWRLLGIADPHAVSMLTAEEMMALAGRDAMIVVAHLLDALFPDGHDVRVEGALVSRLGAHASRRIGRGHRHRQRRRRGCSARAVVGRASAGRAGRAAAPAGVARRHERAGVAAPRGTDRAQCLSGARCRAVSISRDAADFHRCRSSMDEAVSGGFLSFGMMADRAYALASAQIRVMDLRAMARVTKIPHEELTAPCRRIAGIRARRRKLRAHGCDRSDLAGAVGGAARRRACGVAAPPGGRARGPPA